MRVEVLCSQVIPDHDMAPQLGCFLPKNCCVWFVAEPYRPEGNEASIDTAP
jgi:hypothetical protein